MRPQKRRLEQGCVSALRLWQLRCCLAASGLVKSRDAGTEDVTQTTAMVSCGDLETYRGKRRYCCKNASELGREVKGKVTQVLVAEATR